MQSYREPSIGMVRSAVQMLMHIAEELQPRSSNTATASRMRCCSHLQLCLQGSVPAPGGISEPLGLLCSLVVAPGRSQCSEGYREAFVG